MRPFTVMASCLLLAAPLVSFGAPAQADNGNDFMGQAQRFLNNKNGNDRGAYERGRDDEMRRQQAEQDRDRYRRDDNRTWSRDDRDRSGYGDRSNYR